MATTYGLTDAGFVPKTLEVIQQEYEDDFAADFGAGVNLEPESVNGQLVGIFAERDAEMWEALTELWASWDPDQATGAAQDSVMGITGTIRHSARASTADVLAVGTTGTVLTTGRVFSVQTTGVKFQTLAPATLAAVSAWAPSSSYLEGALVARGGNIYWANGDGDSGISGPAGTSTSIEDGGLTWRFLGAGSGAVSVPVVAQVTGAKPAYAWTLSVVETAVSGLNAVANPLDAVVGQDIETWAAARVRREQELQASGKAAVDAIRGELLQVTGVTAAFVFENDSPTVTNGDGMPPNSVEAVVEGGADEVVRAAVFASKGAGITAVGTNTGTVVDAEGNSHAVAFTRPAQVLAYLDITVTTDEDFPSDGIALIKEAIVDWGTANLGVGATLPQSKLYGPIYSVPGITDVPTLYLGLSAWPVSEAPITTTGRQEVKLDTSRIRVNGV